MLLTSSRRPAHLADEHVWVAVEPGPVEAENTRVPQAPQHGRLLLELVQLCRARALHDLLAQHLDRYQRSPPLPQQHLQV